MPRPPLARERVLEAYEQLILSEGDRTATLDATARAAGVSKGGLLYHFASRDALVAGLLERLEHLIDNDLARMQDSPEGAVRYYMRTSVMEDEALDRALIATSRLAQGGIAAASEALRRARERWADAIRPLVRDRAALDLVLLLSDGLYFNNSLDVHGAARIVPRGADLERLMDLVEQATTPQ